MFWMAGLSGKRDDRKLTLRPPGRRPNPHPHLSSMIGESMIQPPNSFIRLKKMALACALVSSLAWFTGCVDINDAKVQVQAPGQIENYSRNVIDKCTPQAYPHRLIVAKTTAASPLAQNGSHEVVTQEEFEKFWNYVSVLDEGKTQISALSQIPIVDWSQQVAFFSVIPATNSCEKTKPYGDEMTTDCYTIKMPIYRYLEGTNCGPPDSLSVFIYIYPKVNLPVIGEWFYPTLIPTATIPPTATPTATSLPVNLGKATPTPESGDE